MASAPRMVARASLAGWEWLALSLNAPPSAPVTVHVKGRISASARSALMDQLAPSRLVTEDVTVTEIVSMGGTVIVTAAGQGIGVRSQFVSMTAQITVYATTSAASAIQDGGVQIAQCGCVPQGVASTVRATTARVPATLAGKASRAACRSVRLIASMGCASRTCATVTAPGRAPHAMR